MQSDSNPRWSELCAIFLTNSAVRMLFVCLIMGLCRYVFLDCNLFQYLLYILINLGTFVRLSDTQGHKSMASGVIMVSLMLYPE